MKSQLKRNTREIAGHVVDYTFEEVAQRKYTAIFTEQELDVIPHNRIISWEEYIPKKENEGAEEKAEEEKEKVEEKEVTEKKLKATILVPINCFHGVSVDDKELRGLQTPVGAMLGLVVWENNTQIELLYPCVISIEQSTGKISYRSPSLSPFNYTLFKTYLGEFVPQQTTVEGYVTFLNDLLRSDA